jgi:hypothetical protein
MRERIYAILANAIVISIVLSIVSGIGLSIFAVVTGQDSLRPLAMGLIFLPVVVMILGAIAAGLTGNSDFEEKFGKYV